MVADRDVAADFAVVGVHVVDCEADLLEAVADEAVLAAGNREDAVAAVADGVVRNGDIGGIPERDAVAGLAEPPAPHAFDDIAQHARPGRAMDVDAEQVAFETVVFDQRAFCRLLEKHAGIHGLKIAARSADGNAADRDVGRRHRDDAACTPAVEHRARPPGQYQPPLDPDRSLVFARRELDEVALLSPVQHRLQRLLWASLQRLRNREARDTGGDGRRRKYAQQPEHWRFPPQTDLGSTNMRPFISMCMA